MPAQDQITQQQPMDAARGSSEQPRAIEPMTIGIRGGDGEGEAVCCGLCAGLCCFECCECCC